MLEDGGRTCCGFVHVDVLLSPHRARRDEVQARLPCHQWPDHRLIDVATRCAGTAIGHRKAATRA